MNFAPLCVCAFCIALDSELDPLCASCEEGNSKRPMSGEDWASALVFVHICIDLWGWCVANAFPMQLHSYAHEGPIKDFEDSFGNVDGQMFRQSTSALVVKGWFETEMVSAWFWSCGFSFFCIGEAAFWHLSFAPERSPHLFDFILGWSSRQKGTPWCHS